MYNKEPTGKTKMRCDICDNFQSKLYFRNAKSIPSRTICSNCLDHSINYSSTWGISFDSKSEEFLVYDKDGTILEDEYKISILLEDEGISRMLYGTHWENLGYDNPILVTTVWKL